MNPQETLILIKDEIKTEEVESLSFDAAKTRCRVVFHNGKAYEYSAGNVVCLTEPCLHEFKKQKISANGLVEYTLLHVKFSSPSCQPSCY